MQSQSLVLPATICALGTAAAAGGLYLPGVYQNDSVFFAAGFQSQDAVTLFLVVPVLIAATVRTRARSPRARLVQTGAIAYFLYVYASMALGASFNRFFLLYVGLMSASLFALLQAVAGSELRFKTAPPQRATAAFMFACGLGTAFVWLLPVIASTLDGRRLPFHDSYTTAVTYALDLAIITPATFVAGRLVIRGESRGYLLAGVLTMLLILLAPVIVLSTFKQIRAGIAFSPAEVVGPIAGFLVLGLLGLGVLSSILARLAAPGGASTDALG